MSKLNNHNIYTRIKNSMYIDSMFVYEYLYRSYCIYRLCLYRYSSNAARIENILSGFMICQSQSIFGDLICFHRALATHHGRMALYFHFISMTVNIFEASSICSSDLYLFCGASALVIFTCVTCAKLLLHYMATVKFISSRHTWNV